MEVYQNLIISVHGQLGNLTQYILQANFQCYFISRSFIECGSNDLGWSNQIIRFSVEQDSIWPSPHQHNTRSIMYFTNKPTKRYFTSYISALFKIEKWKVICKYLTQIWYKKLLNFFMWPEAITMLGRDLVNQGISGASGSINSNILLVSLLPLLFGEK